MANGRVGETSNGRNGDAAAQNSLERGQTLFGRGAKAPAEPETLNEGTDVGKSQRLARPMRVPSRGSAASLASWFGTR
jgi:hypothetical protein